MTYLFSTWLVPILYSCMKSDASSLEGKLVSCSQRAPISTLTLTFLIKAMFEIHQQSAPPPPSILALKA